MIYGTTNAQTAKIANTLASELRSLGSTADVINAKASPPPVAYRAVAVAASVHAGGAAGREAIDPTIGVILAEMGGTA